MSVAVSASREILYIPVDKIKPNPYQPRRFFDSTSLEELSRSIKEYGVIQPISVRLVPGYCYELVAGERRLRASRQAGLLTIPAIVVNISDQDSAVLAIIENLQRQNLHFLEEARGFQNLIQDYSFTQEELAEKIGKSQSTIANKMRILKLSQPVQQLLMENDLTERHARAILKLEEDDQQIDVLKKVISQGLTVKKTEELVENYVRMLQQCKTEKNGFHMKRFIKDVRIFTNTVKQAVDLMVEAGVDTVYQIDEMDSGCEIKIKITY